jgi:hypothetical protein
MQERVLDLRRRFLPDNDPEIGDHDVHSDLLLHVSAFFCETFAISTGYVCVFNVSFRSCHE